MEIGEIITINGVSYKIEISPDEEHLCDRCDMEDCEMSNKIDIKGCYISPHDVIFKNIKENQKDLDP